MSQGFQSACHRQHLLSSHMVGIPDASNVIPQYTAYSTFPNVHGTRLLPQSPVIPYTPPNYSLMSSPVLATLSYAGATNFGSQVLPVTAVLPVVPSLSGISSFYYVNHAPVQQQSGVLYNNYHPYLLPFNEQQAKSSSDEVPDVQKSNKTSQILQTTDTVQSMVKEQSADTLKRQSVADVTPDVSEKAHFNDITSPMLSPSAVSLSVEKKARLDSAMTETTTSHACKEKRKKKRSERLLADICSMVQEEKCFEEELRSRYNLPATIGQQQIVVVKQPDNYNDKHVNAKHADIYPSDKELECIQKLVSLCEKCLRLVSNKLPDRVIHGVARVDLVAKGLFLRGDRHLELVVLCSVRPTSALLLQVVKEFRQQVQLERSADDTYEIEQCTELAGFAIELYTSSRLIKTRCFVTLTSPLLSQSQLDHDAITTESRQNVNTLSENLSQDHCLAALTAVRRAKWFQAKANGLPSCVVILRVMRDFCNREPVMSALSLWALELLVEHCIISSEFTVKPGSGLRRVFECLASGILLPGGAGLLDPCEKGEVDATACLSRQQKEDITSLAQMMLRLIAFRKIHRVLDMTEITTGNHRRLS